MNELEVRLTKLTLKGDRKAFEQLVQLYTDKIYRLAYRMLGQAQEAEDIVQETFLRVYKNLERYDDNQKFSTWIYRIATNLCIDRLRKRRRKTYSLDAELPDSDGSDGYDLLPTEDQGPDEQVLLSETQRVVRHMLAQLPEKYKAVVVLKYLHDRSLQEISDITGMPVSTIKTRIHRGREYLRKKMNKDYI